MDEMLRYIFKSMKNYDQELLATASGFKAVAKFFKAQNKINKLVAINLGLFMVMHWIAYAEAKELLARVEELERAKKLNKGE